MHIEKMKLFIDLYECRNYTETARNNFISQSSLSQYINTLEKEFDVQLFDRSITPIEPTEAGRIFYREACILWKQYQNMQYKMSSYGKCKFPPLKLAYTTVVDIQTLLPRVSFFKTEYPQVELQLNKILIKDTVEYLQKSICDLVVSFESEFTEQSDIATYTLYKGNYMALVGLNHPLFHREYIMTEELYQYPFIMMSPERIGKTYGLMVQKSKADGYVPNIQKTADEIETELFSIITDNLIGFIPENYPLIEFGNHIRKIPIKNTHHSFKIQIGYLKNNQSRSLKLFLETIKK